MLNLKKFSNEENAIKKGTNFIAENPNYNLFDQDILNYCFSEKYFELPTKFNFFVRQSRINNENFIQKKIYHYLSHNLQLNYSDNFNRLWLKYFAMTPFFNEKTLENFSECVQKIYFDQKRFAIRISEILSGKTRAFFIPPYNVDVAKEIFNIKFDEEIILAISQDSLKLVINSIIRSNRKKVFFLVLEDYSTSKDILTRAGLKDKSDFLNAFEFLTEADGVTINSYNLMKLL